MVAFVCASATATVAATTATIPDGRLVSPVGFTIPVGSFTAAMCLSPDGKWIAVLSVDRHSVELIDSRESVVADRLNVASATGMTWTADGLYVTQGYTGKIARYAYDPAVKGESPALTKRPDLALGPGLLNGIAEDPATHLIAVARTAAREVVVVDDGDGTVKRRLATSGQPFDVVWSAAGLMASLYDAGHVDVWWHGAGKPGRSTTGPHPTAMLAAGGDVFVAEADGHEVVEFDGSTFREIRRFDLSVTAPQPPGQTPSGMALSGDGKRLYVAESGFNDVAVVDLASGSVIGRIPTAWYPMAVVALARPTVGKKDPRVREQLWIASAKGLGSQPDPAGEWNGTYSGLVQHVVVEPAFLDAWSATVASNDRFASSTSATPLATAALPAVKHIVVIVRENKQFDEEFADEPGADVDPTLLLYGRTYTPNAHALAERYTLFDHFMSDGEASIYGHSWLTQGMTNDYLERNAHAFSEAPGVGPIVPPSIWPYGLTNDVTLKAADMDFDWFRDLAELPVTPRVNVSGVFGPRGELIDELQRHGISYRVYGEQMTMLPDGRIARPLPDHADRDYPGAHIDFGLRDTSRAKLFLADVAAHGLDAYTYVTLPTDHTAGSAPGLLTPASFVADNDVALGDIIAGLSKRPEWPSTVVFVTPDDAQGTGDHLDAHRMPVFAAGPLVRRGFVDHTRYALPSILRTVELAFGLDPLNIYDAAAPPITDAFALQPLDDPYDALAANVPIVKNPGIDTGLESFVLDGPWSEAIPDEEWASIKGGASLAAHRAYLARLGRSGDPLLLARPREARGTRDVEAADHIVVRRQEPDVAVGSERQRTDAAGARRRADVAERSARSEAGL